MLHPLSNFTSDRAENSIMQTITIAISAILIAAGLVTAPGLINNARDNNARGDLANVAYAQEFLLADRGEYANSVAALKEAAAANDGQTKIRFTQSGKVELDIKTCASPKSYIARAKSESGKYYYRSSTSAKTTTSLSDLSYDSACIDASDWATPVVTPPSGVTPDAMGWKQIAIPGYNAAYYTAISTSFDGTKAVIAAMGGGLYTTSNSGDTWQLVAAPGTSWGWRDAIISADGTKYAVINSQTSTLWVSSNGTSWTEKSLPSGYNYPQSMSMSDNGNVLAIIVDNQILTSTNNGDSWNTSSPTAVYSEVAISADGTHLAASVDDVNGQIYTSSNSGVSWTAHTVGNAERFGSITASANGSRIIAAEYAHTVMVTAVDEETGEEYEYEDTNGGGQLWESNDYGMTWSAITSLAPARWVTVTASNDMQTIIANGNSNYSIPFVSNDGGATWTEQTTLEERSWADAVVSGDGSTMYVTSRGYVWIHQ